MALKGLRGVKMALAEIDKPINNKLKAIYLQGLGNVAGGTPVDEDGGGRSRSNWFLSVGKPSNETTSQKNGDPHLDNMPANVLGKRVFYTNNMPYINTLEYGGYRGVGPKTVAAGGGIYSDQRPGGWVRKELLVIRAAIRGIK